MVVLSEAWDVVRGVFIVVVLLSGAPLVILRLWLLFGSTKYVGDLCTKAASR